MASYRYNNLVKRATNSFLVHEMAQDYGLESFSVGKGEERYVVVCSRQPTHSELTELRGLKKNEAKTSHDPEPHQPDDISPSKSHKQGWLVGVLEWSLPLI